MLRVDGISKPFAMSDVEPPKDRIDGYLPLEWKFLHAALRFAPGAPREREGWRFSGCPDAPHCPIIPGAPPHDGVYRGSWVSPGVCLVLELSHPNVPGWLAARLRELYPQQVGRDGAFYEFGIASRSQRDNCETAFLALLEKCQQARGDHP
jgi:hypothetical protein